MLAERLQHPVEKVLPLELDHRHEPDRRAAPADDREREMAPMRRRHAEGEIVGGRLVGPARV